MLRNPIKSKRDTVVITDKIVPAKFALDPLDIPRPLRLQPPTHGGKTLGRFHASRHYALGLSGDWPRQLLLRPCYLKSTRQLQGLLLEADDTQLP
jgi:hypothetical protein